MKQTSELIAALNRIASRLEAIEKHLIGEQESAEVVRQRAPQCLQVHRCISGSILSTSVQDTREWYKTLHTTQSNRLNKNIGD